MFSIEPERVLVRGYILRNKYRVGMFIDLKLIEEQSLDDCVFNL